MSSAGERERTCVADEILQVEGLKTHFFTEEGVVRAVDDVSFTLSRGRTLGIVGESGSGKSVTNLSVLRLIPNPPGRIVAGRIVFDGQDLVQLSEGRMRAIRGKRISMIFQDPMTSLNPYLRVSRQLTEVLELHEKVTRREARQRSIAMLEEVGIPEAAARFDNYPHEFSGGMRQRVMIAMALLCKPELLIADEPTTALDVTTQANILDLIRELQDEMGMSVMFITHDLGVVAEIADEVVVMYLGQVCERGPVDDIFGDPKHPYTQALLRSIPKLEFRSQKRLEQIRGMVPHPFNRPKGCPFATRCDRYMPTVCDRAVPPVTTLGRDREVWCFLYGKDHVGEGVR
jgi:oligopeptide/dipeptide ABC transporter ATP-binding protein